MRFLLRGLLVALLALAALAGTALWLALERAPRVAGASAPGADALEHLRRQLRVHDPRRLRPGNQPVLVLSSADLGLLAGQGARLAGGAADAQLGAGTLELRLSLPLPRNPLGTWANLKLQLREAPGLPEVDRLTIGRLALPGALARPLVQLALSRWDPAAEGQPPLRSLVQSVQLAPEQVSVRYVWRADALQRLAGWLLPPAQRERLRAYQGRLAMVTGAGAGPLSLPSLMAPMFALARERSTDDAGAAAENRAALLTLALYVTGRPLNRLLPGAGDWPRARWRAVLVRDRIDFPQHLLVSAALAATVDGPLADAFGLAKEVSDAREGSGFSFNDMALNRAGTRLGELAVREPRRLQARLAGGVPEEALAPKVDDLPEFLPEATFVTRYGGVGAPAYERLVAEIDARVAALPLLP
jgi:hypothetical protein